MKRIRDFSLYAFLGGLTAAGRHRRYGFPPARSDRSNRGFTLLEVMTVAAIVAIMSGIAVYSINTNLNRIRADSGIRKISLVLNYARIRAIAENTNYVVQFKVRSNAGKDVGHCYIYMYADINKNGTYDAGEKTRTEELPKGIIYNLTSTRDIYNNVVTNNSIKDGIVFTNNEVTLLPRGDASEAGEIYIIPDENLQKGIDNYRRAVSLERLSGKPIIWYYDPGRYAKGLNPWKLEGE
jgi:prepilin-type N-terminal cleavage/methylation domain-containing protein